jgi:hypothetical protein
MNEFLKKINVAVAKEGKVNHLNVNGEGPSRRMRMNVFILDVGDDGAGGQPNDGHLLARSRPIGSVFSVSTFQRGESVAWILPLVSFGLLLSEMQPLDTTRPPKKKNSAVNRSAA